MKKAILVLLATGFICFGLEAQTPEAFKYQAVVRDVSSNILASQTVSFRMSILQGGSSGTPVYVETHTTATNQYGLVNLNIGMGVSVSGTLDTVDWGNDTYFLQIELDPAGGSLFALMGTSQLLSVPYALYAKSADYNSLINTPAQNWDATGGNIATGAAVTDYVSVGSVSELVKTNLHGDLYINEVASATAIVVDNDGDGLASDIEFRDQNAGRWTLRSTGEDETGADAGSNFFLLRRDDANSPSTVIYARRSDGQVGIGTNNPTEQLEVGGNTKINGVLTTENLASGTGGGGTHTISAGSFAGPFTVNYGKTMTCAIPNVVTTYWNNQDDGFITIQIKYPATSTSFDFIVLNSSSSSRTITTWGINWIAMCNQ